MKRACATIQSMRNTLMFVRCLASHSAVMPAHSRPKDGVATLAYVTGIHALLCDKEGVDGRVKPGHDER
jgi:hypothetical protein